MIDEAVADDQERDAHWTRGEMDLIAALRAGDEQAFRTVVARYHGSLIRVAGSYLGDRGGAEDVAQETWQAFLRSLDRFEGRCSIKTWLFRILFKRAHTLAAREKRFVALPEPALDAVTRSSGTTAPIRSGNRTVDTTTRDWPGAAPSWRTDPERILMDKEILNAVRSAIDDLPAAQATVITLRDVEGVPAREVCAALGISAANQRVLLHRARTKVRQALVERLRREEACETVALRPDP